MAAGKVDNIYYTFYPDGFAQAAGEAVQKLGAGKSTNEEFLQELQDAWVTFLNNSSKLNLQNWQVNQ